MSEIYADTDVHKAHELIECRSQEHLKLDGARAHFIFQCFPGVKVQTFQESASAQHSSSRDTMIVSSYGLQDYMGMLIVVV